MANTPKAYTRLIERLPDCAYNGNDRNNTLQPWAVRHVMALMTHVPGFERAMVRMVRGWLEYAETHERTYDAPVGDDGVLGKEWEAIGDALRGLLNGDCKRLDCGTVDGILLDAMKDAGIDTEAK
jgi:hypothetical protein